ncbi:MAG TPA: hypothetical protein PK498_03995 [Candidatus Kapabacteria bacterium]|nr:hypothetical protein [Candidatus Kapabacteria bacterium]
MAKKIRIQDVLQPGDILALLIIISGILIAIFLEGLAIKLIGISSAVLGALALIIMISQRLSEIVESNKFNIPETQNIKMTVIKDASAKRQTVENFNPSIEIDKISTEQTMGADEGFRIVSKTTRSASKSEIPQPKNDVISSPIAVEKVDIPQIEQPETSEAIDEIIIDKIDDNVSQNAPAKDTEDVFITSSSDISQTTDPEIINQEKSSDILEDVSDAQLEEKIALEEKIKIYKGVYAAMTGPNLETRAEYRMLRYIGADVVGMSTVPENIVANYLGMEVFGLSVVTDECYPDSLQPVSLEDVILAASQTEPLMAKLIVKLIENL